MERPANSHATIKAVCQPDARSPQNDDGHEPQPGKNVHGRLYSWCGRRAYLSMSCLNDGRADAQPAGKKERQIVKKLQ